MTLLRTAALSLSLVLAAAAPAAALGIDPFFPSVALPEPGSDLSTQNPLLLPTPSEE